MSEAPKHAVLSASGSSRWLNCPPSARLVEGKDTESIYAAEGTLAHAILELKLRAAMSDITKGEYTILLSQLKADELYRREMLRYTDEHVNYVLDNMEPDDDMYIEEKVDYSEYAPGGFGTVDTGLVNGKRIHVIDFKYGIGVKVSAKANSQLKLYALGLYDRVSLLYDIHDITLTVIQPRISNYSTITITTEELLEWAYGVVVPAAKIAWAGEGKRKAGPWCQFCKVAATCVALHDDSLVIAKADFNDPEQLSPDQLVEVFLKTDSIKSWLTSVHDYIMKGILAGHKYDGLKVVRGSSKRRWADNDTTLQTLRALGYDDEAIANIKPKSISDIVDVVSEDEYDESIKKLITKPPGAPKLVESDDGRPAIGVEDAINDFSNL